MGTVVHSITSAITRYSALNGCVFINDTYNSEKKPQKKPGNITMETNFVVSNPAYCLGNLSLLQT